MTYFRLSMGWLSLAETLKISPTTLATSAGLPEGTFSRGQGKVSGSDYIKLWRALESHCRLSELPILIGKYSFNSTFNVTVSSTLCSENMIFAVDRLSQYRRLISPVCYQTAISKSEFTVTLTNDLQSGELPESLILTDLTVLTMLIQRGTQRPITPLRINTNFKPIVSNQLKAMLGVAVTQGEHNSVVFARTDAEHPFATASPLLWEHYEPLIKEKLKGINKSQRYSLKAKRALYKLVPSGRSSISDLSNYLNVTPRTLQRRLKEEGISFGKLLHTVRSEMTLHYLKSTNLALYEIAFLLGFKDQNSFFRAFHQWTGTTPEAARKTLQGSSPSDPHDNNRPRANSL